jgi:hypothetical protein
MSRRHVE